MAFPNKTDYRPLLEPGIHDKTLQEVKTLCVLDFGNNPKRRVIFDRFSKLLERIFSLSLDWEIWINGSYVTAKPNPGDIDVLFIPDDPSAVNNLDTAGQELLKELFLNRQRTKFLYWTDAIFDPLVKHDPNRRMYWRGVFGFGYGDKPKGWIRLVQERDG